MRFKARISKECLLLLLNVTASLDKMSQQAIMYLNPENMMISLIMKNTEAPRSFAHLHVEHLFEEYRIESQSENQILFEIQLDLLSRALTSGKNSDFCYIKLVKRGSRPCLCFETNANMVAQMNVAHDIPIKVMRVAEHVNYLPPAVPPASVVLKLPRGKMLRVVVEKLSKLAKEVTITAEQSGRLNFCVQQSQVTVNTLFSGLIAEYPPPLTPETHAGGEVNIKIEMRKLAGVLGLYSLPWDNAVACK